MISSCPEVDTVFKINEVFLMKDQQSVSKCKILQYGMRNQVAPVLVVLYKVDINKLVKKNLLCDLTEVKLLFAKLRIFTSLSHLFVS